MVGNILGVLGHFACLYIWWQALARKTVWEEVSPDAHHGLGQRIIATDSGDVPLLELRELVIRSGAVAAAGIDNG